MLELCWNCVGTVVLGLLEECWKSVGTVLEQQCWNSVVLVLEPLSRPLEVTDPNQTKPHYCFSIVEGWRRAPRAAKLTILFILVKGW